MSEQGDQEPEARPLTESGIVLTVQTSFDDFLNEQPYPMDGGELDISRWFNIGYYPRMIESVGAKLAEFHVSNAAIPDKDLPEDRGVLSRIAGVMKRSYREKGIAVKELVDSGQSIVAKIRTKSDNPIDQHALGIFWDIRLGENGLPEANLTRARVEVFNMSTASAHGGTVHQATSTERVPIDERFKFGVGEEIDLEKLTKERRIPTSVKIGAPIVSLAGAAIIYVTHKYLKNRP